MFGNCAIGKSPMVIAPTMTETTQSLSRRWGVEGKNSTWLALSLSCKTLGSHFAVFFLAHRQ